MTITLFVGDCTVDLAIKAQQFDENAYLVDFSNFEKFLLLDTGSDVVAYTSFADLPKISTTRTVFYEVLRHADQIYYAPPNVWSDYKPEFSLQNQERITEYFLYLVNHEKNNVVGLNLEKYKTPPYLALEDSRVTDRPQLWVSGCSVTAGVGVEQHERFATLIAEKYNLVWSDLAKGSSSIEFQADQLLRSDIRKNDIVLWGVTSEYRATIWSEKDKKITFLNAHKFNHHRTTAADDVCDETRTYKAMISINQVINFCNKIGAQLIIVPILCTENLQLMLQHEPSYYQLPYIVKLLDVGTDGMHPGPAHHRYYAEQIGKIFNKVLEK